MAVEYSCCDSQFFIRIAICIILVLFAGLMSGLTLGLMSLSLVELEVLAKSGTPNDRKFAAAMEALPIFLDSLVTAWAAVLLSVTLILLFGEIIPQAVCSRYGLAIGAAVAPLLLDLMLGKEHKALFRRSELKTLVDLHGNEAGKGGELTHDETTVIAGALELTEKTARNAMTPIAEIFAIDIDSKLDRNLMKLILDKEHSRVPVYYENPTNILGLILVKNLLTINPEDEMPVKNVTVRKIPRVTEKMPLYDILNEFEKGRSHMAVVVRKGESDLPISKHPQEEPLREVRVEMDGEQQSQERQLRSNRSLKKLKSFPQTTQELQRETSKGKKRSKNVESEILDITEKQLYEPPENGEAIGIITMEDVIEELLQEEIYDETDYRHEN
ncbi:DUF21 domain-containing protein At2g14520-like [Spinacia oleracea]|uniref:DUF21 domain-containing protein At2g14520-like n=1 Tax=Spinacia oleracea TaxID=3562 RepID=A0A9R0JBP1_SPIOL|nr:DUF21 domain-containing protein At2g14520-like [Spinacia oleracea]